jgi:hypothetical protein
MRVARMGMGGRSRVGIKEEEGVYALGLCRT